MDHLPRSMILVWLTTEIKFWGLWPIDASGRFYFSLTAVTGMSPVMRSSRRGTTANGQTPSVYAGAKVGPRTGNSTVLGCLYIRSMLIFLGATLDRFSIFESLYRIINRAQKVPSHKYPSITIQVLLLSHLWCNAIDHLPRGMISTWSSDAANSHLKTNGLTPWALLSVFRSSMLHWHALAFSLSHLSFWKRFRVSQVVTVYTDSALKSLLNPSVFLSSNRSRIFPTISSNTRSSWSSSVHQTFHRR